MQGTGSVSYDLGGLLLGVCFLLAGLVVATDYRGIATWYVRASIRVVWPLRHVPPWRWLKLDQEKLLRSGLRRQRIGGAVFAAAGCLFSATAAVALVRALS